MQSDEHERQLSDYYGAEEAGALVAVLKCTVGLLILIIVAAGPWLLLSPDEFGPMPEPAGPTVTGTFSDSLAESRRIFEERRQRYESRRQRATPTRDELASGTEAVEHSAER